MGWVTFKLSYGLRLETKPDLAESVRGLLDDGKEPGLLLVDLSPSLQNTEMGQFQSEGRSEPLQEEDYESCQEGEGWSLLMYSHCSEVLDESNGVNINTNRCYNGGHLEFLRGDCDPSSMPSEAELQKLRSIAAGLGVPFQLSFSLRAEGSGGVPKTWFR